MSKALGKRKRGEAKTTGGEFSNANDLEAILQRHFESRFKPLETKPTWTSAESIEGEDDLDGYGDDDDKIGDSSEDQWDGISDDEDDSVLQIRSISGVPWSANSRQHPCPLRHQCQLKSRL